MKVTISSDQNTVQLDGITLVAHPIADQHDGDAGCEGCYYEHVDSSPCCYLPCNAGNRGDETIVIFKLAE